MNARSNRRPPGGLAAVTIALLLPACGGGQLTSPDAADAPISIDSGWTPAPACLMAFDPGPCRAAIPVYAFDGVGCASRTYGGCEGNDNRFTTLEECLAACEGRPVPNGCPSGRTAQEICLGCGPAGGCANSQRVCALPCDADAGTPACGS
jgi:hypothetical protein